MTLPPTKTPLAETPAARDHPSPDCTPPAVENRRAPVVNTRRAVTPPSRGVDLPILPPVRKFSPQPDFPVAARAAGLEGAVTIFGVVGKDGNVREARVLRGLSPELDQAALAAFRSWRYEPARQGQEPVDFRLNVNIQFQLDASTPRPRTPPPLEIGGDVSPPVRVTMVWPTRPQAAQLVHGEIILQLVIDELGNVSSVRVVQGLPQGLTEAAIEAVRQWKYRPAGSKINPSPSTTKLASASDLRLACGASLPNQAFAP